MLGRFVRPFALLAFFAVLFRKSATQSQSDERYLSDLVNFVNDGLNRSVNPCDDFYGYVCSNHTKSSADRLQKHFYDQFRPLIENDTKYPEVSSTLLSYVDQCVTFQRNLSDQRAAWQDYLKKYGSLLLVNNTDYGEPNFWKGLLRIILLSYATYDMKDFPKFGFGMSPLDIHFLFNSSTNQLYLFAGWGIKRIEERTQMKFDEFFDLSWNRYMAILSAELEISAEISAEREKVVEFAQQFQKLIEEYFESSSNEVPQIPLRKLKSEKLREAISELLPYMLDESVNMAGLKVTVDEKMIEDIGQLFVNHPKEGQRFIHVIAMMSTSLTLGFRSMHPLNETEIIAPYQCFFTTLDPAIFGPIFSLYAVDLAIRQELQMTTVDDQLLIRDMVELVRQEIRQKFIATYWMKHSRELLENLDHLLALFKVVGFAEYYYEDNNITKPELSRFSRSEDDLFSIVERIRMSNLRLIYKLPEVAYGDSFLINAANKYTHIVLYFLPLQNPYFNRNFPDSYNIGLTGSIIGHELFHSFAPTIVQDYFYQHVEYNKSLACYERFYSEKMCYNVTIVNQTERVCADGENDLMDNIPDVEGTRVAFETLKRKLVDNEKLKLRPLPDHFDFTNEQLFFIARSQFWCDNDFLDEEYFVRFLRFPGPHAPHNVRVNAVPMQMNEFAQAFNCKPTDKMVTREEEKCYLLPSGK